MASAEAEKGEVESGAAVRAEAVMAAVELEKAEAEGEAAAQVVVALVEGARAEEGSVEVATAGGAAERAKAAAAAIVERQMAPREGASEAAEMGEGVVTVMEAAVKAVVETVAAE